MCATGVWTVRCSCRSLPSAHADQPGRRTTTRNETVSPGASCVRGVSRPWLRDERDRGAVGRERAHARDAAREQLQPHPRERGVVPREARSRQQDDGRREGPGGDQDERDCDPDPAAGTPRASPACHSARIGAVRLPLIWLWRLLLGGFVVAYFASGTLQLWVPPLLPFLAAVAVEAQFFVSGLRASGGRAVRGDRGPQERDFADFGYEEGLDAEEPGERLRGTPLRLWCARALCGDGSSRSPSSSRFSPGSSARPLTARRGRSFPRMSGRRLWLSSTARRRGSPGIPRR